MDITVSEQQGRVPVTVFHIRGEMTADTAGSFEAEVTKAIQAGTKNLLLDLTEVPFIGSFGIRAMNNVLVALYEANGQREEDARKVLRTGAKAAYLKVLNPNPQVMRVLETSGFDMLLDIKHDMKSALASF